MDEGTLSAVDTSVRAASFNSSKFLHCTAELTKLESGSSFLGESAGTTCTAASLLSELSGAFVLRVVEGAAD